MGTSHMFRNGPFLSTSAKPSQHKLLIEGEELTSLGLFSHSCIWSHCWAL